jgi:hypothetical protein
MHAIGIAITCLKGIVSPECQCILVSQWTAVFIRFLLPLALAHWLEEFVNCPPTKEKNEQCRAAHC